MLLTIALVAPLRAGDATSSTASGYLRAGSPEAAGIVDLALIYQGGLGRPKWSREEVAPYISWADTETSRERWLFDAFLFLELRTRQDSGLTKGFGKRAANKAEWLEYLDSMFAPGQALDALDKQVAGTVQRIGPAPRPRQVILSPPEPYGENWGELDGRPLDFNRGEDRLAAYAWFTRQAHDRFTSASLQHLKLAGFYWLPEHVRPEDTSLTRFLADFSHQRGLKTFYIPYFNAAGSTNYREHGFDVAWLQPNYFFTPSIPEQRLHDATQIARENHMGVEMEWDGRALDASTSNTFAPRMWSYLKQFEADGVWANATVAHYEGGGALLKVSRSSDILAQQLFQQYCKLISQRQEAVY
jgi:hypothetical protein